MALALLGAVAGCTGGASGAGGGTAHAVSAVVVLPGEGAAGWIRLLRAAGVEASATPAAAVRSGAVPAGARLVVLPGAGGAPGRTVSRLAAWTRGGGTLVTAQQPVLAALGVSSGAAVQASGLAAAAGEPAVTWAQPAAVRPLDARGTRPLVRTSAGATAALRVTRGRGTLLALGVDPLGGGRGGYELLPGLGADVAALPGAESTARRLGVDLYLDPGTLPSGRRAPAAIARRLAADGVRAVHVAAWDLFDDAAADYDYRSLVSALHARGVLAYAWLEPPFVSLRLWQDHPECRERNRAGRDAFGDWRRLIALEDPSCFIRAAREWRAQLATAPWDGVDVAEMYFEPGPTAIETPYSKAALRAFGADPQRHPAAFAAFRTRLATRLNQKVLAQLAGLPGASRRETVLTVIDDTLDPDLAHRTAQDLPALARVAAAAGATLEVEDPFSQWSQGPLRYSRIAARLATLASAGAAMIDVNVVDRPGARPTTRMTGGELDLALTSAGGSGRVAVYAFGTIAERDLRTAPATLGSAAHQSPGAVTTPWTVQVAAPDPGRSTRLLLDAKPWPCAGGHALVPAGHHTLTWSAGAPAGPGLRRFTGELGTAETSTGTLRLTYFSRATTYAVVDQRPTTLRLDGAVRAATVYPDPDGGWTLQLPPGQHDLVLSTA